MMPLIHVVDDDAAVRESLGALLGAFGYEVRGYDSAAGLLASESRLSGCVLTDVQMPDMDGLELQRALHARGNQIPVIIMTGQGDIAIAVRAMKEGAVDFLEKPFTDDALHAAVQRAFDLGGRVEELEVRRTRASARLATLTPREREVLDLLVTGVSSKEIARELGGSPRTVEVHRAHLYTKLETSNLAELIRLVEAVAPQQH